MKEEQLTLNFPASILPTTRPDGGYLVIPGKPVAMEKELTVKQVAELTNYSRRQIQKLARQMGARQMRRRGKLRIPASAVALWVARQA